MRLASEEVAWGAHRPIEGEGPMKPMPATFRSFDMLEYGVLSSSWQAEASAVVDDHALPVATAEKSSTSRGSDDYLEYSVVTGDVIRQYLGWLDDLYRCLFLQLAAITV